MYQLIQTIPNIIIILSLKILKVLNISKIKANKLQTKNLHKAQIII